MLLGNILPLYIFQDKVLYRKAIREGDRSAKHEFFQKSRSLCQVSSVFFSTEIYAGHLMMCRWGWRYFQSKKVFKDIDDPKYITRHFTQREVSQVKKHGISFLIIIMHGIAYYIPKLIWPEVFN